VTATLRTWVELPAETIVGQSPAFLESLELADRLARDTMPILIVGATGTGKELVARRIHRVSRRPGQLVPVNCFSLRPDMAHGLLFGHRRGAFTGAVDNSNGFYRQAEQGTLFLDEVSSLALESQAALLRVIETGEVQPLGAFRILHADVRVLAAAQDGLERHVAAGSFRADLYERLAIGIVRLPLLRERADDIPLLATWFAARRGLLVNAGAQALMQAHTWPGNVRELRATIERAGVLTEGPEIGEPHIRAALEARGAIIGRIAVSGGDAGEWDNAEKRRRLLAVCEDTAGDIQAAADRLGTSKSSVYRWLRKFGLSAPVIRRAARQRARMKGLG
jgi:DNA-binding NtrC family response regulator